MTLRNATLIIAALALCSATANAQNLREENAPESMKVSAKASTDAPSSLVIFFDVGSSKMRPKDNLVLDRASRAYSEGKPIVMIISGNSDRTGDPQANLILSQQRPTSVLRALLDRGIPADRFQVLAKGETELPVATPHGVSQRENRRVVITWR